MLLMPLMRSTPPFWMSALPRVGHTTIRRSDPLH